MENSHRYSLHLTNGAFKTPPYRSKSLSKISKRLSVVFRFKTTTRVVLTNAYSSSVLTQTQRQVTRRILTMGRLSKFTTSDIHVLCKNIEKEFRELCIPETDRVEMTKKVVDKATSMLANFSKGRNCSVLTVKVHHEHDRIYSEIGSLMVPATDESIKNLEREEVVEDKCCSICYDEMATGSVAAKMPCSHAFHGECIEKWLKTSRYCPLCRYQMPTDQDSL